MQRGEALIILLAGEDKALSIEGNPQLAAVLKIIRSLELRLQVIPIV
jgi:DNA-binding phage protein